MSEEVRGNEMTRLVVQSKADRVGVLHLDVPLGELNADSEVEVTITTRRRRSPAERVEWLKFIESTAGAWQGDLVRPPQGEYEQREELP